MKYLAVFYPEEDDPTIFNVYFPDFDGACTWGQGLKETRERAKKALEYWVEGELMEHATIPHPSQGISLRNAEPGALVQWIEISDHLAQKIEAQRKQTVELPTT